MNLKRLVASAYVLSGTVLVLLIAVAAYAQLSRAGKPKTAPALAPTPAPTQPVATTAPTSAPSQPASTPAAPTAQIPTTTKKSTTSTSSSTTSSGSGTSSPPTTPPPSSPPPAPAPCGGQSPCYNAATVGTHNSAGNCWVIVGSIVYNVTNYVSIHPGGPSVFNSSTCGHDISSYLSGSASTAGLRHTHSSTAYTILNSYKIGYYE